MIILILYCVLITLFAVMAVLSSILSYQYFKEGNKFNDESKEFLLITFWNTLVVSIMVLGFDPSSVLLLCICTLTSFFNMHEFYYSLED